MTWTIGSITVERVEESVAPVPFEALVPDGAAHVASCRPWIDPFVSASGSHLLLSVHSFVVSTPATTIVVDTCIGTRGETALPGDPAFGDRLDAAIPGGLDGVDVVICTHLHFDHVGWNTVEVDGVSVPTFPNARYLVTHQELGAERDAEDTAAFERAVAPLRDAGVLDPVDPDHRIDDWVRLRSTPGHTPGHVAVELTDGGDRAIITGDLVHTPLQFRHPDAASRPDADPGQATATRRDLVADLVDTDVILLGTHFAPPTSGYLVQRPDGVAFE